MQRIPLIVTLFFLFSLHLSAQRLQKVIFHKYTQSDGLSSYNITKIFQDTYGFIWIGTQDGINRFNGISFDKITSSNEKVNKKLSGNNVSDFVEDTVGKCLWVATSYGGITRVDIRTFSVTKQITTFDTLNLAQKWIRTISIYEDIIWLGTDKGVFGLNLKTGKSINPKFKISNSDSLNILRSFCDRYGRVWAFCVNKGIIIFDGKSGSLIKYLDKPDLFTSSGDKQLTYGQICHSNTNQVIIPTNQGLIRIIYDSLQVNTAQITNLEKGESFACDLNKSGDLIFSTIKGLWNRNQQGLVTKLENTTYDGNGSIIYRIFVDAENNTWLGLHDGIVLIRNMPNPFLKVTQLSKTDDVISHVYSICPVSDDLAYAGGEDGLYKVDFKNKNINNLKKGASFYLVVKISPDYILASSTDGLYIIKNGKLSIASAIYPELDSLKADLLNSAVIDNENIYLGSQRRNGYYKWTPSEHTLTNIRIEIQNSLDNSIINTLYKGQDNKLKIISEYSFRSFNFNKKNYQSFSLINPVDNKPCGILFDLCETKNNCWFAAYGMGIVKTNKQYKVERIISLQSGLSNKGVYKLFPFKDSLIICTSNYGLSVYNISDNKINNYYTYDGLHTNSFEQFSGTEYNNMIYAGGNSGFTIIDPSKFSRNKTSPLLYFINVKIEKRGQAYDTSDLELRSIEIPNDQLQTNISFIGINYSNPARVIYEYRIKEQDSSWINLGSQNSINLVGVKPGTYHLQVKAANEDGVWSEPKELILEFLPKWYQTWWFKLLVFLTTAAIIYAFYRYRIRQIEKQHAIRKNIATDLHDDLGSTLNSVKVFTNLAISGVKQEESLQQVKDNLTEATMSLRDMIWVLDDSLDTVDELITRLKQFAIPVASASKIEANIKADSEINNRQLTKEEKRNLFLICKEAINNSIKYSGATQIDVTITDKGKKIQIVVADNGKGFNVDEVKKGYGLKNMQYRAGQIKYKLELVSSQGKGTQIIILPS